MKWRQRRASPAPTEVHVEALKPAILPPEEENPEECVALAIDENGRGLSDEFVSLRKTVIGRDFFVIANMLLRIGPRLFKHLRRGPGFGEGL